MQTSDIFNTKPQTARSIQTRGSMTFQHQNIFNQEDSLQDQSNKYQNNLSIQSPMIKNGESQKSHIIQLDSDKLQNPQQPHISKDDVCKSRKFKSWQSNIFNEPAKENFNQNVEISRKSIQDKIDIGAYDVNWWNTKNYPQVENEQNNTISPAKMIEEHNQKLLQIQNPQIQIQEKLRINNKNFSDLFDSGLAKYYDIDVSAVKLNKPTLQTKDEENQSLLDQKSVQSVVQNTKIQQHYQQNLSNQSNETPHEFAKKQKLRGMSSVFDTHNYYSQMIQQTQTDEIKQPEAKQEVPIQSPLISQTPSHKYVRLVIRGLNQKFDKEKFNQFCQNQNCYLISFNIEFDDKKKKTHALIVKYLAMDTISLTNIEKYLISQSGRLVKKENINEEDYIASLGPILEIKPNVNPLIALNKVRDNYRKQLVRNKSAKQKIVKKI